MNDVMFVVFRSSPSPSLLVRHFHGMGVIAMLGINDGVEHTGSFYNPRTITSTIATMPSTEECQRK